MYFMLTYAVAVLPAATGIAILGQLRCRRFWHFAVAGFFVGVASTVMALALVSHMAFFLLAIGPIVGGIVWIICEWHPTGQSAD